MSSLEYRFPPLTPEERERGRQRVLRSYRPNVARYFRNAESLRQDVVEEMKQAGATAESLAEKSPANLPRECVTCRLEDR